MSAELWGTMFNAVADCIISLFGFFFTIVGAATTALLALAILSAVIRLIVKPIMGYKLDNSIGLGAYRQREFKQRREKMRQSKGDK